MVGVVILAVGCALVVPAPGIARLAVACGPFGMTIRMETFIERSDASADFVAARGFLGKVDR